MKEGAFMFFHPAPERAPVNRQACVVQSPAIAEDRQHANAVEHAISTCHVCSVPAFPVHQLWQTLN